MVAVFELLRHNIHANLICIDKRDRQQHCTVPQDWCEFFEHGYLSWWMLISGSRPPSASPRLRP